MNQDGDAVEDLAGSAEDRRAEIDRRKRAIEGVEGGNGGEVLIANINHLGGHRYAGVMLVSRRSIVHADCRFYSRAELT